MNVGPVLDPALGRLLAFLLVALIVPWAAPADAALGGPPMSPCTKTAESYAGAPPTFAFTEDTDATRWATWAVAVGDVAVPAPPGALSAQTAQERVELHRLALERTPERLARIAFWDAGPAGAPWERSALDLLAPQTLVDGALHPPAVSRHLGILTTTIHDALVLAYVAKYCHQRAPPSALDPTIIPAAPVRAVPSYPSEHAVVAGAASVVLRAMYPHVPPATFDAWAREAAESRLWAGVNFRSDVEAGLALGRAVAERALQGRVGDGAATAGQGPPLPTGPCHWQPTPPAYPSSPLAPGWGRVRPFALGSGSDLRPPPPPTCDGPVYRAQTEALLAASRALTPAQRAIAERWAGGPGTDTPPGMGVRAVHEASLRQAPTTMTHARVMAAGGAAVADAGIAAWDTKYAYAGDRPVTGIQRLYDPAWTPVLQTPPFPGYVSGHATFSGASSQVVAAFFPHEAGAAHAVAEEAAISRFYGGIHIEADNEVGLDLGRAIGQLAAERALRPRT